MQKIRSNFGHDIVSYITIQFNDTISSIEYDH